VDVFVITLLYSQHLVHLYYYCLILNLLWIDLTLHSGILDIAKSLIKNTSVTSLTLSGNQMSDEDLKDFIFYLKQNQSITNLELDSNNISAQGAGYIAELLQIHPLITSLSVKANHIGNNGFNIITTALKNNQTLTYLELDNNFISMGASESLEIALKGPCLTSISISNNIMDDAAAFIIASQLKLGCGTIALNVENNKMTEVGITSIWSAIHDRTRGDLKSNPPYTIVEVSKLFLSYHGSNSNTKSPNEDRIDNLNTENDILLTEEKEIPVVKNELNEDEN